MCGIAGAWQAGVGREAWEALLDSMGSALRHRGPDDAGTWCDPDAGIGVVSRRLAIIDVSPLGHQPMTSASERFVVAYNGELYNFQDLRPELKALRVHPAVTADVDRDALALFLRHGYVPAPYSIYRGIAKLVPGSILTIDQRTTRAGQTPVPERYWSAKEAAEQGARDPFT